MNRIAQVLARTHVRIGAPAAGAIAIAIAVSVALLAGAPAQAQSSDQIKADFARAVYLSSAAQVHNEQPQPLLRAVVVLRIRLNDQTSGRPKSSAKTRPSPK